MGLLKEKLRKIRELEKQDQPGDWWFNGTINPEPEPEPIMVRMPEIPVNKPVRAASPKIERIPCAFCGTIFLPTRRNGRFCKDDCRTGYANKKDKESRVGERECGWCGGTFNKTKARMVYCSDECADKKRKLSTKIRNSRIKKPKRGREFKCGICGSIGKYVYGNEKYCSDPCKKKARKKKGKRGKPFTCQVCGRVEIHKNGNEKYCLDCRGKW